MWSSRTNLQRSTPHASIRIDGMLVVIGADGKQVRTQFVIFLVCSLLRTSAPSESCMHIARIRARQASNAKTSCGSAPFTKWQSTQGISPAGRHILSGNGHALLIIAFPPLVIWALDSCNIVSRFQRPTQVVANPRQVIHTTKFHTRPWQAIPTCCHGTMARVCGAHTNSPVYAAPANHHRPDPPARISTRSR